jgi:hypothetical protein
VFCPCDVIVYGGGMWFSELWRKCAFSASSE